jgi:chromosome segregation ATPase
VIYAALAAVVVGLLAWDFGRRWLVSYERAKEAALIRAAEIGTQLRMELDGLKEHYGDSQSTINLQVRELSDTLDALLADKNLLEGHRHATNDWVTRVQARVDALEALLPDVETLKKALEKAQLHIAELAVRPEADPVDLTKYNKAVENLARQLHELSKVSATQAYVQEQLDASEKRLNGTMSGAITKGARRLA